MAIAIITIRDDEENDSLTMHIEFEPALVNDEDAEHPLSALMAISAIEHLKEVLGGEQETTVE